jgi:hypothetical protein
MKREIDYEANFAKLDRLEAQLQNDPEVRQAFTDFLNRPEEPPPTGPQRGVSNSRRPMSAEDVAEGKRLLKEIFGDQTPNQEPSPSLETKAPSIPASPVPAR